MSQYKKAIRFLASQNVDSNQATDLSKLTTLSAVKALAIGFDKIPLIVANDILRITMYPKKLEAAKAEFKE